MIDDQASFDTAIYGLPSQRASDADQGRDALELLASRFLDELRRGQEPCVDAYAENHPELAEEIQELFPLLSAMEGWKSYRERHLFEHRSLKTLPNDRFGDFQIVREIGRGGMGIVFEAVAPRCARPVAIKVLPFLKASALGQNFEREAQTAARLRHRHIVPVHRFGEHEGVCYYVMPLIEGVGLDWVIDRLSGPQGAIDPRDIARRLAATVPSEEPESDRLHVPRSGAATTIVPEVDETTWRLTRNSWFDIARIGAQIADALHHAHSHGILHRDIKPANLLLDARGEIWVTDFGLAQSTETLVDSEHPTAAGTLRYLAPEQFEGRVDARSDIYSLGLTLFELSTRTRAFPAPDRKSTVDMILNSALPRPRSVNPRIPRDLEAIVIKATARDAALRYRSAAELWADLVRFLRRRRVHARGALGWLRWGRLEAKR
jgi:eukaryotic-like serine/threonine-protein kinase